MAYFLGYLTQKRWSRYDKHAMSNKHFSATWSNTVTHAIFGGFLTPVQRIGGPSVLYCYGVITPPQWTYFTEKFKFFGQSAKRSILTGNASYEPMLRKKYHPRRQFFWTYPPKIRHFGPNQGVLKQVFFFKKKHCFFLKIEVFFF